MAPAPLTPSLKYRLHHVFEMCQHSTSLTVTSSTLSLIFLLSNISFGYQMHLLNWKTIEQRVLLQRRTIFRNWEARGEIWLTKSHNIKNYNIQKQWAIGIERRKRVRDCGGRRWASTGTWGHRDKRKRVSCLSLHLIASDCDFRMSALDCFFHP